MRFSVHVPPSVRDGKLSPNILKSCNEMIQIQWNVRTEQLFTMHNGGLDPVFLVAYATHTGYVYGEDTE